MNRTPSEIIHEAAAKTNQSVGSNSPISERDTCLEKEDSSGNSSSSDSCAEQEEPPCKKQKTQVIIDPRIDALYNQANRRPIYLLSFSRTKGTLSWTWRVDGPQVGRPCDASLLSQQVNLCAPRESIHQAGCTARTPRGRMTPSGTGDPEIELRSRRNADAQLCAPASAEWRLLEANSAAVDVAKYWSNKI
ncbi:unnamed protein product, partial [Iphiclides podalirius]